MMTQAGISFSAIRPAVLGDLDALVAMDALCFPPSIAYPKEEIAALLDSASVLTLVAEGAGGVAGFAATRFWRSRRQSGVLARAELVTIDVLPEFRRAGIGLQLHEAIEDWLVVRGCGSIELHAAVDNAAAIAFYGRLGYESLERVRGYYPGRTDGWRMMKELNRGR